MNLRHFFVSIILIVLLLLFVLLLFPNKSRSSYERTIQYASAFNDNSVIGYSRGNTIYEIKDTVDLGGETVVFSDSTVLLFKNEAILKNGKIEGDFTIEAPSRQLFENVDISSVRCPLKFVWIIGNRKVLSNNDFMNLPNVQIDFEGISYEARDVISLDKLEGFNFINLNISTKYQLHFWHSILTDGLCSYEGEDSSGKCRLITDKELPDTYAGYIIEIKTSDETKFDSRPDDKGIPSLYKGITSKVQQVEGNSILISDSLEPFSKERLYNGNLVQTLFKIYEPKRFVLSNCHFVFSNKTGISLRGCDFLIDNCIFESTDGSNTILSLGGHKGIVRNCTISGSYYHNTSTSYGIQLVGGTGITIENCSFIENRRGVDFSGSFESRYNEVKNCYFYQEKNKEKTGSAIGGHSTSFGNVFRENVIIGDYQVGIQCRGEDELIDGNLFNCTAATMISFAYNTQIVNNKIVSPSRYAVGVFAGSVIKSEGNTLRILNNEIELRRLLVNGDGDINYIICDNTINYIPNTASIEPIIFSQSPNNYEFRNNSINCSRRDVSIKLFSKGEVIL